jgi:hypothetical protein
MGKGQALLLRLPRRKDCPSRFHTGQVGNAGEGAWNKVDYRSSLEYVNYGYQWRLNNSIQAAQYNRKSGGVIIEGSEVA